MNCKLVFLALSFAAVAALGLSAAAPASSIEISIEATVDVFDSNFGNALPPQIGDNLSIRLAFDDAFLELPAVGETVTSGFVPLSFTFTGGGLSFEGTSGSFTVVNANNSAADEFYLTLSDAGMDVDVRTVVLLWTARNFAGGQVDLTRANRSRLDVNQIPAGGFEARIDATTVVPEPGTAVLLGLGLAALSRSTRRMLPSLGRTEPSHSM